MATEVEQKLYLSSSVEPFAQPPTVSNRSPTPQDLLELSSRYGQCLVHEPSAGSVLVLAEYDLCRLQ